MPPAESTAAGTKPSRRQLTVVQGGGFPNSLDLHRLGTKPSGLWYLLGHIRPVDDVFWYQGVNGPMDPFPMTTRCWSLKLAESWEMA
ncbi:hypothetical protein XM38_002430 [Halomicronema hongdechloris C2206]|uniref:Uncharacterized protein n=2 Tax=Halomicronema hongdechloris TaxID=1209493 RepID=A0A1Z3HGC1_9CYAN|nr:hypothetical protein XM38_002430 [Halomicronema hongdechloris C2206]